MKAIKFPKIFSRKKKLRAATTRRATASGAEFDDPSEPNMKLSRALLIVLLLHVVVTHPPAGSKKPALPAFCSTKRKLRRWVPITNNFNGQRFFVRIDGRLWATPLFVVLLVIETTDVFFAVDSIPAIFAITLDPFIVYTSNVFAIMGLRSMYFALAGLIEMFRYLHYGLSLVLVFVGAKMLLSHYIEIPIHLALAAVAGVLAISVIASIANPRKKAAE